MLLIEYWNTKKTESSSIPVVCTNLLRVPKVQAENLLLLPKHRHRACNHG